ncbi:MAG: hypothetical protein ACFFB3_17715 [Candidatus Hodarchaeota archaeon]
MERKEIKKALNQTGLKKKTLEYNTAFKFGINLKHKGRESIFRDKISFLAKTKEINKSDFIVPVLLLAKGLENEEISLHTFFENILPLVEASKNLGVFKEELNQLGNLVIELNREDPRYAKSFIRLTLTKMEKAVNLPEDFKEIVEEGIESAQKGGEPCDLISAHLGGLEKWGREDRAELFRIRKTLDKSIFPALIKAEPQSFWDKHRLRAEVLQQAGEDLLEVKDEVEEVEKYKFDFNILDHQEDLNQIWIPWGQRILAQIKLNLAKLLSNSGEHWKQTFSRKR